MALRYTSGVIACQLKTARRENLPAHRSRVGRVRAASAEGTRAKRLPLRIGASSCKVGRFLQVDPIIGNTANSQSLNSYSYVGNNPLSGTDPTGYAEEPARDTRSLCNRALACSTGTMDSVAAIKTAKDNSAQAQNEKQMQVLATIFGTMQWMTQTVNTFSGQVANLAQQFPDYMDSLARDMTPITTTAASGAAPPGSTRDNVYGVYAGAYDTVGKTVNDFGKAYVEAVSMGQAHLLDDFLPIAPIPPQSQYAASIGERITVLASISAAPGAHVG